MFCQGFWIRFAFGFFVLSFLFNFINLFKYFLHLATYGNLNLSLYLSVSISVSFCWKYFGFFHAAVCQHRQQKLKTQFRDLIV